MGERSVAWGWEGVRHGLLRYPWTRIMREKVSSMLAMYLSLGKKIFSSKPRGWMARDWLKNLDERIAQP